MGSKAHLRYYEKTLLKSSDSEQVFLGTLAGRLDENWFVFHSRRFIGVA
jgi:hypothetical protein